ncbi:MAG TPA: cell division protein FtsL [Vicinamibacterales bacterium]|jgi:cell division protein FtsL
MHGRAIDTIGFEVNPPIPNQPIRLEVDPARQREFRRWLLIGLVLVVAALFDGWQRYGLISHGYRLEDVQRARAREEGTARHLRLEIETLRSPARIEKLATTELNLVAPTPTNAIVIERVVPPDQPPSSVVAKR